MRRECKRLGIPVDAQVLIGTVGITSYFGFLEPFWRFTKYRALFVDGEKVYVCDAERFYKRLNGIILTTTLSNARVRYRLFRTNVGVEFPGTREVIFGYLWRSVALDLFGRPSRSSRK